MIRSGTRVFWTSNESNAGTPSAPRMPGIVIRAIPIMETGTGTPMREVMLDSGQRIHAFIDELIPRPKT